MQNCFRVSDLIETLSEEDLLKLCDNLYDLTDFICEDYPKHKSWFYQKHLPSVLKKNEGREIIFVQNEISKILGTAFTKKDEFEKKICTLFVSNDARGLGVGTQLVEACFEVLGTTKPMITLADYKLHMFQSLIKKYNWELSETVSGLYNDKHKELVYNGSLKSDNKLKDISNSIKTKQFNAILDKE